MVAFTFSYFQPAQGDDANEIAILVAQEIQFGLPKQGVTIYKVGHTIYIASKYQGGNIRDLVLGDILSSNRFENRSKVVRVAGPWDPTLKVSFSKMFQTGLVKFLRNKSIAITLKYPIYVAPRQVGKEYFVNMARVPAKSGSIISYRFNSQGHAFDVLSGY